MLIKVKRRGEVSPSEITPQGLYLDRRRFLRLGAGSAVAAAALSSGVWEPAWAGSKLPKVIKGGPFNAKDELTPYDSRPSVPDLPCRSRIRRNCYSWSRSRMGSAHP